MFDLSGVSASKFNTLDELLSFTSREKGRTVRLPLKGLWASGARFFEDARFGAGETAYSFNDESFRVLCNYLSISELAVRNLTTQDLATCVLNDLLQSKIESLGARSEPELIVDEEQNIVLGLVSARYVGYSNDVFINDVLHALSPKADRELFPDLGGMKFKEAYSVNSRIYVRLVSKSVQGRISGKGGNGDDVSEIGTELRNSMAGEGAVKLSWFVYRLICKNGLVAKVAGRDGRVVHSGSEGAFRERLYLETAGIISGLRNAKQMIETLGSIPFDPDKLAKHVDLKLIYSILPDRDLHAEVRQRIGDRKYDGFDRAALALKRVSDELLQVPQCVGGQEALRVFNAYFRDGASMYDFVNVFTERAKDLPIPQRVDVETKAGLFASWVAANKRKFA